MKLLFDENISFRLVNKIKDLYPEVAQVKALGLEISSDREIWDYAKTNNHTIVTFDADFYDFSLVWGHPPKVIWIRTGNLTTNNIELLLREHFEAITDFVNQSELACLEIIK